MDGSGYFRLILYISVILHIGLKAQTLHMCGDQIEKSMCEIVCITLDLSKTIAFYKLPDTGSEIAQCIPFVSCFDASPYTISQPNSTATILTFEITRNITGQYRCAYGSLYDDATLNWGTYPEDVVVTDLANGSAITSTKEFTLTLQCLRSAGNPTVFLKYEDIQGNIDATSDQFSCSNSQTSNCDHDDDLTSYHCPCTLRHRAGIDCKDEYDVDSYITITHIETQWNISIVEDITFQCQTTTTIEISTDSFYEKTTHDIPTIDNTTEINTFLNERVQITTKTTTVDEGYSGDTNLLLITAISTFSFCGVICFVTIFIISRFLYRTYLRNECEETKESNLEQHTFNTSNKHFKNTKIDDSSMNDRREEKKHFEMMETEIIEKKKHSQYKCKQMFQSRDPYNVYVEGGTEKNDTVRSPSCLSYTQEADLRGYVFYRG